MAGCKAHGVRAHWPQCTVKTPAPPLVPIILMYCGWEMEEDTSYPFDTAAGNLLLWVGLGCALPASTLGNPKGGHMIRLQLPLTTGGPTPRFWTPTTPPTNCWLEAPGGGGDGGGGVLEGRWGGGGSGEAFARGRGESRRVGWLGGVQVGQFGGHMPPRPSVGPLQAPLASP